MNLKIKPHFIEILIGVAIGAGAGLALASMLLVLSHAPLPSLWPPAIKALPLLWLRLQGGILDGAMLAGAILGGWYAAHQTEIQHVRGVRFYRDPDEAQPVLQAAENARMSEAQRVGKVPSLVLGGVAFSRKRLTAGALFVGLPGSGKTVCLSAAIHQILHGGGGDRVLVHDPKGDYTAALYDPETCVLLGPWDARAALWSPEDIDSPALAAEFADAVTGAGEAQGNNRYFYDGASAIVGGLIKSYLLEGTQWRWIDLARALQGNARAMAQQAERGDARVRSVMPFAFARPHPITGALPGPSQGERGVISTVGTCSRMLLQLAAVDHGRPDAPQFSMRRWLTGEAHTEIRTVILNNNAAFAAAAEAIFGAILRVLVATTNSALMKERGADEAGLWLIIDEAPQLGEAALEHLQRAAEVARSRGVRTVLAAQDESQFAARMGLEKAAPLLAMQSLRVYAQMSAAGAESVCERVGDRDVKRLETTGSGGALQGKTSRAEKLAVLVPSDLTELRAGTEGVELLVAIDALIGKVLQPYAPKPEHGAAPFIECEFWRRAEPPREPDAPAFSPDNDPPPGGGGRSQTLDEPAFDGLDIDLPGLPEPAADGDDQAPVESEWRE
ncbi:type IV secretion system DNA-binding domain-containing protein [Metallibacterium scheffleri]